MLIADVPNAPPSTPPVVMVAQASTGKQATDHVLGICDVVNTLGSGQAILIPPGYVYFYSKLSGDNIDLLTPAKVSIIQQPAHGRLEPDSRGDWEHAKYIPSDGYLGKDSFVIQVEENGYKVKLHYFMAVTDDFGLTANPNPVCKGEQGRSYWKISQDANGTPTLTAINYPSPTIDAGATTTDTAALASTLESSILSSLSVDPSSVTFNLANLTGGAVGQDVGTNITLDTTAAGNGWFIDTTPADNSEFLATSNPNEWVAKAGSAAAGKMDMLSVLLHEYGHALGIEHSTDPHDFMEPRGQV